MFRFLAAALLLAFLQACAPRATLKEPEVHLPEQYPAHPAAPNDTANAGDVSWHGFFEDPHLLHLIDEALENNKEINVMMARIQTYKNEIGARKGELLPFVELGQAYEREHTKKYEEGEFVEEFLDTYKFGAYASWEVDVWKKLRKATRAAVYEYFASVEGVNFLKTELVAEVAASYFELKALDSQLAILERNIALQEEGLEIVKRLKRFARTNQLAIKRYEGEVAKNKAKIYEVRQQIVEVENRINFLLGRLPQPVERSHEDLLDTHIALVKAGLPIQLLRTRPDIRQAELELKAAKLNVDVARARFYPALELQARRVYAASEPRYLFTPESLTSTLAGELTAPLLNRSLLLADYKNASARQIQAAYEYEQKVINAFIEVTNELIHLRNLEREFQLKRAQVEALSQSIELSRQLFQSARVEYLEVLLAQREALEAKMELVEIRQQQLEAVVALYRALGGGWK